jgi:DNA-binding ferritin-like protein
VSETPINSSEQDPIAALNAVLGEILDFIQEVKQAHWKIPDSVALHAELDSLFDDTRTWAQLLIEQDQARAVPLSAMTTVAGRTPPNVWPGQASEAEVRTILYEHLQRLERRIAAARAEQWDDHLQSVLTEVDRGTQAHQEALAGADDPTRGGDPGP